MHNFNRTMSVDNGILVSNLSVIEDYVDSSYYKVWIPASAMIGQQKYGTVGVVDVRWLEYDYEAVLKYSFVKPKQWVNGVVYLKIYHTSDVITPVPNSVAFRSSVLFTNNDEFPVIPSLTQLKYSDDSQEDSSAPVLYCLDLSTYNDATQFFQVVDSDKMCHVSIRHANKTEGSAFSILTPIGLVGVEVVYKENRRMHGGKIAPLYAT